MDIVPFARLLSKVNCHQHHQYVESPMSLHPSHHCIYFKVSSPLPSRILATTEIRHVTAGQVLERAALPGTQPKSRFIQPWHYWPLGLENSWLQGASLCTAGCSAAPRPPLTRCQHCLLPPPVEAVETISRYCLMLSPVKIA